MLNLLFAQSGPATPAVDPATVSRIAAVALRRWFAGLTLSPNALNDQSAKLALLFGFAALLLLAILMQGPWHALRQFLDIPGHFKVVAAALSRFRRAGRLVAALLGASVISWTTWQSLRYSDERRLTDLAALLKAMSTTDLALEQGLRAALTPLRDLLALADPLILLAIASFIVFKLSADRFSGVFAPTQLEPRILPRWTPIVWSAAWAYLLYRAACSIWEPDGLPLTRLLGIDALLVPPLALSCDGMLLAWVLSETRKAFSDAPDATLAESAANSLPLWPASVIACALVFPARWISLTAWLALPYIPQPSPPPVLNSLIWILRGPGLVWLQACALPLIPVVGAAAWATSLRDLAHTFLKLFRAQGGRLVAVILGCSVASAALSTLVYTILLQLPPQPWLLAAADSYAHYASLLVGLLLVVTLVELTGSLDGLRPTQIPADIVFLPDHAQ